MLISKLAALWFAVVGLWVSSALAEPSVGDDCGSCHIETAHVKAAAAGDKCKTCHGEDFTPAMVSQVSQAGQTQITNVTPAQVASADRPGLLPGMVIPMFYDDTRIGAEPNEMILIPGGDFIMGTNERLADEGPQHVVNLPPFYIDKYEVTNLQYKQYLDVTGRRSPDHFRNRTFPEGKADHPVTYVSWKNAKAYCEWAGKRLPTDREWEKAARGTDARTFPWGNEFVMHNANTPVRWGELKQEGDTSPVGAFPGGVSPYGLYDVSGNVWEWTASWYMAYPGNERQTENYGKKYRTLKGGSWWDCSFYKCGISAPVYNRSFFSPKVKNSSFGFRCAKDA